MKYSFSLFSNIEKGEDILKKIREKNTVLKGKKESAFYNKSI